MHMCKHAENTKQIIDHLLVDVYPQLNNKIADALNCLETTLDSSPELPVMINLINEVKNELTSLVTYEQKLVFPSVLKVFHSESVNTPMPNLADLLQLTRSKEHKLMQHIKKLALMLQTPLWETKAQQLLVTAFVTAFVEEKAAWYKMIDDRLNSCSCFMKNYFEITKLQAKKIAP